MADKKLESLAYRLSNQDSLRELFAHLNYEFQDEPVNKDSWKEEEREIVEESRIIAKRDDYKIYYLRTNTDSLKKRKGISSKIIKENHGLCLICTHNPSGFKWVFSSLSREFSRSFTETRHIPIDIRPDSGAPKTFVDFLEKIQVSSEDNSTSILAKMSDAFDTFAIEIHDELTVNVFEALKTISEGIIFEKSNNFSLSNESIEKVREPIFILLYRIIFVLYAEDRGIFPIDNKIYHDEFSLRWIKEQWLLKNIKPENLEKFSVQNRLKKLFRLIEVGSEELDYNKNEFLMSSYYGRIFDRKINHELEEWNIPNSNLLQMLNLLTRSMDKKGNSFFLDYSALETRHLGSIYEGLLEYHLTVEKNKIIDLPNPEDRKSSASYYTPEPIVQYIVKNTIDPLIEKIQEETDDKFEHIEKILTLNILDPAMGSGHFLIGVVNYLASRICEIEHGVILEDELIKRKRDVARRCVYGVDLNPLAVDLAMVSLWLETLSSDKPLSFLSAHLKNGNSLIGSKIESLFNKQTTLMESQKGREQFKRNIKDFIMFENLEDDSSSAVKIKLAKYQKIQSTGSIYYNIQSLLDCKVAESFGLDIPVISDFKAKIAENSLDFFSDDKWEKIKNLSYQTKFFHWDLEFPDIFYDENGDKRNTSGFDVVLGNPPYIKISILNESEKKFLFKEYNSAKGRFDLYILFIEKALSLVKSGGYFSFITPNKYTKAKNGQELRKTITANYHLKKFIDFGDLKVFSNKTTYPSILVIHNSKPTGEQFGIFTLVKKIPQNLIEQLKENKSLLRYENDVFKTFEFLQSELDWQSWNFVPNEINKIYKKISSSSKIKLGDLIEKLYEGFVSGDNEIFFVDYKTIDEYNLENELLKPSPKAKDVRDFQITWSDRFILYPYHLQHGKTLVVSLENFPNTKKYFEKFKQRLTVRKSLTGSSKKWYEMIRPREFNWFESDKILCPSLSDKNNFCLDFATNPTKKHFFVDHDCYGIILKNKERKNYLSLLGILNSELIEFFIKQKSPMYSGGYYLYQSQYLEQIPITRLQPEINNQLVALVTSLHEKPSDNEDSLTTIKNQINEIIYTQYGINQDEQKLIKDFLRTGLNNLQV